MSSKQWFIHIQGETIGPLPTGSILVMLGQNRLQFVDFVFEASLRNWTRISEVVEFAGYLPQFPDVAAPGKSEIQPQTEESQNKTHKQPQRSPSFRAAKVTPTTDPEKRKTPEPKLPPPGKTDLTKIGKHQRAYLNSMVHIKDWGEFKIADISEGGLYVETQSPPPLGTPLQLTVDAKEIGKALEMTAVVIRHGSPKEPPGFGVEFTRVNPAHKRLIAEYIKSLEDK